MRRCVGTGDDGHWGTSMSGIMGPLTPGRIAFALGTVAVGALVGAGVADSRDGDPARGALYGGLAAAAGLSLLYGGAYMWQRAQAGRAGAVAGASQLTSELSNFTRPIVSSGGTAANRATTAAMPAATSIANLPAPSTLFRAAPALTPAVTATIPAIARTPALPVARASGGTFVDALRMFIR